MARKRKVTSRPLDDGELGSVIEMKLDTKLRRQGWWFDVAEADRICAFVLLCRHSKGQWAGRPVHLEQWQRRWLRRLFGWRRPDGTRRYRRCLAWIPRKNGKSTIAAIVALLLTAADGEPGAQVFSAAANKEQAELVFSEAKNMVEQSAELSAGAELRKSSIYFHAGGGVYRALASKASTKHGLNVHGVIIDEVHAIKGRELYDVLTSASGARVQPMEVIISTAGDDLGSLGYELFEYSVKLRDGVLEDPATLAVVYCADAGDNWRDEATWAKANPNLGVSVSIDFLRGELEKTKGLPGNISAFKQLYLNIWTQAQSAWLGIDEWRRCLDVRRRLHHYRGRKCWGGLDLSSTTDLTALALVFEPLTPDGPLEAVVLLWMPRDTARERSHGDSVQYAAWIDQGYIWTTPGNVIDYDWIERDIGLIGRYVKIQELGFDRWGASKISQRLADVHNLRMVEIGQGYRDMSPAMKELERLILSKGIRIYPNPVLTWQATNVEASRDPAGNIKPNKSHPTKRIDGMVALIMAVSRASLRDQTVSVYASRGLITL